MEIIISENAPKAIGPYSQAVAANGFLFVSGQIPLDPNTGKIISGDIKEQVNLVLDHLKEILKTAGADFNNIVRTEIFLKDLNDFAVVNEEYGKRFEGVQKPSRQTIQAAKLPLDVNVEISCIAVLEKSG